MLILRFVQLTDECFEKLSNSVHYYNEIFTKFIIVEKSFLRIILSELFVAFYKFIAAEKNFNVFLSPFIGAQARGPLPALPVAIAARSTS